MSVMADFALFVEIITICIVLYYYKPTDGSSVSVCKPQDGIIAKGDLETHIYNGFTFITREKWNAKPWRYDICSCTINDTTEIIPFSAPKAITIHHTVTPLQSFTLNQSIISVQKIQEFHQGPSRNFCDIAYHFVIDSAGNVFQGRPFWDDFNASFVMPLNKTRIWPQPRLIQGSHSKGNNTNNIGIVVLGCYDTDTTTACKNGSSTIIRYDSTYTRLVQLISFLCDYYNITPNNQTIVRHKYWNPSHTICPGNILGSTQLFNDIIADVQMTFDDGTPLCYDYSNIQINKTGGICKNSQSCDNNKLETEEDQCKDLGQVCCAVETDNDGEDKTERDWGAIYVIISIVAFVVIVLIIAFILKKRKDWLLEHSAYADLAEDFKVEDRD